MKLLDAGFPTIKYAKGDSPLKWGQHHGEEFAPYINELAAIRMDLLRTWNPHLSREFIQSSALTQWKHTEKYFPEIIEELTGISDASGISRQALVVLNNYTDFRDLKYPGDQGCSTLFWEGSHHLYFGQTWDMHRSARNYLCVIDIPAVHHHPAQLVMSLVGCVGLMGYNSHGCAIGVNNLNTSDAVEGIIWPALVRKALLTRDIATLRSTVKNAPITSGHNYLIADTTEAENWEITPSVKARVGKHKAGTDGYLFHTNHCLTSEAQAVEIQSKISTTTHQRYRLVEEKIAAVQKPHGLNDLLTSHDHYPNSICTHTDSGAKDPSETCGGALGDLKEKHVHFWRGCEKVPKQFKEKKLEFRA